MARKTKKSKPDKPPETREHVVRVEITIEAPKDASERDLLSKILTVATEHPADKAITFADSLETVGIHATSIGRVTMGDETPTSSDVFALGTRWYRDGVESTARAILDELRDQDEIDDDEALDQNLHETIDSHNWIIHTAKARLVLAMSDSPDAWDEEGFGDEATVEQRAFAALRADVFAEIGRIRDEYQNDDDDDEEEDDGED